ncbi:serine proteinase stubble [Eupeodes corollae]|uniref:serine proteinase stubble n=1 Tax=Eupeodes corollae TaxID=290404 RepID=UPI0024918DFC|nr:serine proteinase stubble [Eupeodes corollae]
METQIIWICLLSMCMSLLLITNGQGQLIPNSSANSRASPFQSQLDNVFSDEVFDSKPRLARSLSQASEKLKNESDDDSDDDDGDGDDDDDSDYIYYDDNSDSSSASNESEGRLLSQSAFNRISETLGALNTVGHFIVDMTRGGQDSKSESDEDHLRTTTSTTPVPPLDLGKIIGVTRNDSKLQPDPIKRIGQSDGGNIQTFVENKKKKKKKNKVKKHSSSPSSTTPTEKDVETSSTSRSTTTTTTSRPTLGTTVASFAPTTSTPIYIPAIVDDSLAKDGENRCKTPNGRPGRCEDLSSCPALLLNLSSLRESLCFKSLFVPGVCCPLTESTVLTTQRPLRLTPRPTAASTTIRPPTKRPGSPNLILIPQIKPASTTTTTSTTTFSPIDSSALGPDSNGLDILNGGVIDQDDCGQQEHSTGRIVGGTEAPNGQWPWMAAIFLHGPKRTEFWCGGSLIGSKYILTAAHCTRDSRQKPFAARQFTVRLGDIDLSTDDEPSAPVTFGVTQVRAHERFSRVGFYNDIAILVLDRPVRKSKYVIPVCLPRLGRMPPKDRLPGRRATVVGWGTTYYGGKESTSQRQAELPIWRNEDCDRSYFQPINENFLCAGYSDGGVDACQGDSGGPLMMRYDARWVQLGIVSFGNKCGEPGYPGVYTRVSQYLEWIHNHTRD